MIARGEADPTRARRDDLERQVVNVLLTLVVVGSFALKLHNLGHLALRGLDESFHAIVAANLLEHPLTPTLVDDPYLSHDWRDWQNNHVWLHKPVLPLWQIAASYAMFGVETFALRLPSAIFSTLAVLMTYLIGRELFDRIAALVAAALQAFSPAILMLVHGYAFSDHIDVALLFYVQLGIYFVLRAARTGRLSDASFAGAAQGLAILSKMYPAMIVTGVALVAWLLAAWQGANSRCHARFAARHMLALALATFVVAAPWMISIAVRFPDEFRHEYFTALLHLTRDVEAWAAPWDRLIFGYALAAYYVFYPTVLAAAFVLLVRAVRERDARLWLLHAWAWGVLIPFTLATSKTPSATAIGWPGFFLLLGAAISRATRGDALALGAWLVASLLAVLARDEIDPKGMGGEAGAVFRQNLWILWHLLAALAGGAIFSLVQPRVRWRHLNVAIVAVASAASLWLFVLWGHRAWRVTQINDNSPAFVATAEFVRGRLPANAVLLLEEREKLERNTLMFRARRTTYPVEESNWRARATDVVARGGIPLIVSDRDWPLRRIFLDEAEGLAVYQLAPEDLLPPATVPAVSGR